MATTISLDELFSILSDPSHSVRDADNTDVVTDQDILNAFIRFKGKFRGNSDIYNNVLSILQKTSLTENEQTLFYDQFIELFADTSRANYVNPDPSPKGASSGALGIDIEEIQGKLSNIAKLESDYFSNIYNKKGDISQIGFYKVLESNDKYNVPTIVPTSVTIQERLLNQPVPVLRSKSAGLIPDHRSTHVVSVDILFPNFKSFSNTDPDYPSFINLLNMFKFMPINSIYSSILSTAFVSEYTFPNIVGLVAEAETEETFFSDFDISQVQNPNPKNISDAKTAHLLDKIAPNSNWGNLTAAERATAIRSVFDNVDPNTDIGFSALADNIIGRADQLSGDGSLDASYTKLRDFIANESPFPIPVCFKSASVQTHTDMPGAVIGRFMFGIVSSPAFPYGNIAYRDEVGNPTFDPADCHYGKKYVNIAARKIASQVEIDIENITQNSIDYLQLNDLSLNDLRLYYFDYEHGEPIIFDTANKRYGENPAVILEKISGTFNSKSATIPIIGSKFPTVQYMGMNTNGFQLIFAVTNKQVLADFMALKARIVNSERNQSLHRPYAVIENKFLNSVGISRVSPQSISIDSDGDNPDLYHLTVTFSENYQDSAKQERLQFESGAISVKGFKEIWSYLYELYLIWFDEFMVKPSRRNGHSAFAKYLGITQIIEPHNYGTEISIEHKDQLNKLMEAIGVNWTFGSKKDYNNLQSILNPGLSEHECDYGPLLLGIIKTYSLRKNNIFTQRLAQDFPELSESSHNEANRRLKNIIDKNFELEGTTFRKNMPTFLYFLLTGFTVEKDIYEGTYDNNPFTYAWYGLKDITTFAANQVNWLVNVASTYKWFGETLVNDNMPYYLNGDFGSFSHPSDKDLELILGVTPSVRNRLFESQVFKFGHSFYEIPNMVALFHQHNTPIPKSIWDNTFEAILAREYTKGHDRLVTFAQMDSAFTLMRELFTIYDNAWKFQITKKDDQEFTVFPFWKKITPGHFNFLNFSQAVNVNTLLDDASPRLNLTKLEEIKQDIKDVNNQVINLYPDLYMPTYREMVVEEVDADNNPIDVNKFIEVFGPKHGDSGSIPTFKSFRDMQRPVKEISAESSVTPDHFIDPDIFYYRERDRNDLHNAVRAAAEAYKPEKDLLKTGKTIALNINWRDVSDKARQELIDRGEIGPDEIIEDNNTQLQRVISKLFTDCLSIIRDSSIDDSTKIAEAFTNFGITEIDHAKGLDIWQALKGLKITDDVGSLGLDPGKDGPRTYRRIAHLEFVTNDGKLIANVVKSNKLAYRVQDKVRSGSSPIGFNPVENFAFKLEEESLSELSERTLMHTPDLTDSVLKSFPSIRVYFIEEDRDQSYNQDDFYGYGNVIEFNLSSHIYDNDVCRLKLANFSGVLSSMQFTDYQYNVNIRQGSDKTTLEEVGYAGIRASERKSIAIADEENERFLRKIMLRPGVHIMVKIGYGNNLDSLKTIFTGEIAEVKPGPVVELVAQGYQTELHNEFGGFMEESWWENFAALYTGGDDESLDVGFLKIINYILLSNDAHNKRLSKNNMMHLGEPFTSRSKFKGLAGGKDDLYQSKHDYNFKHVLGNFETIQEFNADASGEEYSWFDSFLEATFFGFAGTDLSKNIYVATSNGTDINVANEWLITNAPVIDSLREVVRYMPNFIATVVPYEQDATLFIGDPTAPYQYRRATALEEKYTPKLNNYKLMKYQETYLGVHKGFNQVIDDLNKIDDQLQEKIDSSNSFKREYDNYEHSKELLSTIEDIYNSTITRDNIDDEIALQVFASYFGLNTDLISNHSYLVSDKESKLAIIDYILNIPLGIMDKDAIQKDASSTYSTRFQYKYAFNLPGNSPLFRHDFELNPVSADMSTLDYNFMGYYFSYLMDEYYKDVGPKGHPVGFNNKVFGSAVLNKDTPAQMTVRTNSLTQDLDVLTNLRIDSLNRDKDTTSEYIKFLSDGSNRSRLFIQGGNLSTAQFNQYVLGGIETSIADDTSLARRSQAHGIIDLPRFGSGNIDISALRDFFSNVIAIRYIFFLLNKIAFSQEYASRPLVKKQSQQHLEINNTMPWNYKAFRDYHILSSEHDIIDNNIAVSETDMWSAVALKVPMDTIDNVNGAFNWQAVQWGVEEDGVDETAGTYRIDSDQSFGIFPNASAGGVNYRGYYPGPKDILETFTEVNSTTPTLAQNALKFRLAQGLSKMYRGNIIFIGRVIKPYDQIQIVDNVNHMYGKVMAERVVHNFNATTGWTTTVVPCGLTRVNSKVASHAISETDKWLYSLSQGKTGRYIMNAATILTFATGGLGTIGTARLLSQGTINTLFGLARGAIFGGGNSGSILWSAVKYPVELAKNINSARFAAGKPFAMTFAKHFLAGKGVLLTNYIGRGALDVAYQFNNASISQSVALVDKSGSDVVVHQPCQVSVITYHGGPFMAGLEDPYENMTNHNQWTGLMLEFEQAWREWWSPKTPGTKPVGKRVFREFDNG